MDYFDESIKTLIGIFWSVKPFSPSFYMISTVILQIFESQKSHSNYVNKNQLKTSYDYVIVGGGSAGSVMASRLSEDPMTTVLLLEAGPPENIITDIPRTAYLLQESPVNWGFLTEPQLKSCFGIKDAKSRMPRGRIMGGSSSINMMIYSRGNSRDYDKWKADGALGWGWADMFPYFIKAENNTDPDKIASGYHGKGGPLTISNQLYYQKATQAFIDAGPYLNYTIGNSKGPIQSVFEIFQRTVRNGKRCSVAMAYLESLPDIRPNLSIFTDAFVTKILFNENKRAVGVEVIINGEKRVVNASKEVILSAGAIQSPQILMLSGIGPAQHLKEFGIKVLSDLPVGNNLQEHVTSTVFFKLNQSVSFNPIRDLKPQNILNYFIDSNNSLSSSSVEALAFVKTKYANQSDDWPDIEFYAILGSPADNGGYPIKYIFGMTDQMIQTFESYPNVPMILIVSVLLRPRSRGQIRLQSNNPFDSPSIDPQFFAEDYDLDVLVEGMKMALKVGQTPHMQAYGATPIEERYPGCDQTQIYSDGYLRCMAQTLTIPSYHPMGTCKMGQTSDVTSVVDLNLRVKGVTRLRVVDASVIPSPVSGNTNLPVVAIAEKIADQMKGRRIKPLLPPMDASTIAKLPDLPFETFDESI